jgi:hypothetical protein
MLVENRLTVAESSRSRSIASVDVLLAATFVLAGIALRLPLMSRSLWRDEGSTYAVVTSGSPRELLHHIWTTEMTPPLYYLVEYGWIHLAGVTKPHCARRHCCSALQPSS